MIRCICIDDSGKPDVIPITHWVKKGETYHINYVYKMLLMGGILGVTLNEIDLMQLNCGYECFKLTRFAIHKEDLQALLQLFKDCHEFNELNLEEMLEDQLELIER
jgi:hypothetical protein